MEANVAGQTMIGDPGALVLSGVRQVYVFHYFAVASQLTSEPGMDKFSPDRGESWYLCEDAWGTRSACSLHVHVCCCSHSW